MDRYNLSFVVGGEVRHGHNARKNQPINADPALRSENVILDYDPAKIVNEWYKNEVDEYNSKQKKNPSRKIKNLYDETKKKYDNAVERDKAERSGKKYRNKQKAPEKEIIIELGDKDNHPDADTAKKILSRYASDFEKRYECFKLTGAYIHADEQSIHMHLDFTYKADRETSLNRMYSFENSLNQMGFVRTKDKDGRITNSFDQWMNTERRYLQEIAKEHEITLNDTKAGEKRKHLDVNEYKQYKEEQKAFEQRKEALSVERETIEQEFADYQADTVIERSKISVEIQDAERQLQALKGQVADAEEVKKMERAGGFIASLVSVLTGGNKQVLDYKTYIDLKTTAERVGEVDDREQKLNAKEAYLNEDREDVRRREAKADRREAELNRREAHIEQIEAEKLEEAEARTKAEFVDRVERICREMKQSNQMSWIDREIQNNSNDELNSMTQFIQQMGLEEQYKRYQRNKVIEKARDEIQKNGDEMII